MRSVKIDQPILTINKLSKSDIKTKFKSWNNRTKAETSINIIQDEITKLYSGLFFHSVKFNQGATFFRARKEEGERFDKKSELWVPNKRYVTKYGRANRPNNPVFYLGKDGRTALFESQLLTGDLVEVAEIQVKDGEKLACMHIGMYERFHDIQEHVFNAMKDSLMKGGLTDRGWNNLKYLDKLMCAEFLKDVNSNKTDDYIVSALVAEYLLSYDKVDALIYPSKKSPNDCNVVVKPSSVQKKLKMTAVRRLRITNSTLDDFEIQYLDAASVDHDNENLNWLESKVLPPFEWPTFKNGMMKKV